MNQNLKFTDTNSADDSNGKTWGLDGNLFWYFVGGAFGSVIIMLLLFSAAKFSFKASFLIALVPLTLTLIYVFGFRQGKPPRYDIDCLEYLFCGKGFGPQPHLKTQHPLKLRHV